MLSVNRIAACVANLILVTGALYAQSSPGPGEAEAAFQIAKTRFESETGKPEDTLQLLKDFIEAHPESEQVAQANCYSALLHFEQSTRYARMARDLMFYPHRKDAASYLRGKSEEHLESFYQRAYAVLDLPNDIASEDFTDLEDKYVASRMAAGEAIDARMGLEHESPKQQACREFRRVYAFYKCYTPDQAKDALQMMNDFSGRYPDTEEAVKAEFYSAKLLYHKVRINLGQQAPAMSPQASDGFVADQDTIDILNEMIGKAEACLDEAVYPLSAEHKEDLEQILWESLILTGQGDQLLEESRSWTAARQTSLLFAHANALYHVRHWTDFRPLARHVLDNPDATDAQILDILRDYLKSYYSAGQFDEMLIVARGLKLRYKANSRPWAICKLYEGIGLALSTPPQMSEAAAVFDEIIFAPVVDEDVKYHIPSTALSWGLHIASMTNDTNKAQQLLQKLQTEMPDGPAKYDALHRFGNVR
jgi:hypothetical protein